MSTTRTMARRTAIATSLAIMTALGVAAARVAPLQAKPTSISAGPVEPSNRWLDGLKSKHKQFFDAPAPAGGIALVHVMNYYDAYNKAFNVKDADIDAVLTFYGGTTFFGVTDAMWSKYKLGEFINETDPTTGKPATSNPWRVEPVILGMTIPTASI